jgi:uncharacterized membrane protein YsdA (DUF1294 family)
MNIIGFAVMGIDKSKARNHKWRTRERTMFTIAILGGSIGVKAGMQHYRHKTQHKQFVYGIPAIIVIQIAVIIYATYVLLIK